MTCVSKINQNDFCLIIVGDGPLRVELEEQEVMTNISEDDFRELLVETQDIRF